MKAKNKDGETVTIEHCVMFEPKAYAVKLPGPTTMRIPSEWVISTNPEFASGIGGVVTSGGGLIFSAKSEVTFADTETFRRVNRGDNSECAFVAWFTGEYPPPPTAVNFSLKDNGFSFYDGERLVASIYIKNEKKLYKPGEEIKFLVKIPEGLEGHELNVRLEEAYGNLDNSVADKSYGDLTGNIEDYFSVERNGIYTFIAELSGPIYNSTGQINIGVISPNGRAKDKDFLFGMQAILTRPYHWKNKNFGVIGKTADESYEIVFDYLLYSGANTLRDGLAYHDISFPGEVSSDAINTMHKLAGDLKREGIKLDWGIGGTPAFAADPEFLTAEAWKCPPKEDLFRAYVATLAKIFASYDNIIWEVYNEPNALGFWTGTRDKYIRTVSILSEEIKAEKKDAVIINGGMVLNREHEKYNLDPEDKFYYENYMNMYKEGKLSHIAIHSHGTLDTHHENYKSIIKPLNVPNEVLFLNESGNLIKSDLIFQAQHTVGKMIYAKANGYAGYVAYHLGAVNFEVNNLTPENDNRPIAVFDYGMISDDLEPKPAFLAYITAIKMLDSAKPVRIIHQGNDDYAYLFEKDGAAIEVNIGVKHTPALSLPYTEYDMFGNENGSVSVITYRVYEKKVELAEIVYDGNGAESTMKPSKVLVGDSHIVQLCSIQYTGHIFTGWNTKADGSGIGYLPGDEIKNVRQDLILYAQWSRDTVRIHCHGNGGSGTMDTAEILWDGSYPAPENAFSRGGYVFTKWNTMADGSGTDYRPGELINNIQEEMHLYAQWVRRETDTGNTSGSSDTSYMPQIYESVKVTLYYRDDNGNIIGTQQITASRNSWIGLDKLVIPEGYRVRDLNWKLHAAKNIMEDVILVPIEKEYTHQVFMTIGKQDITINGNMILIDTAPYIDPVTERTMLPLRYAAVALGLRDENIIWKPETAEVVIKDETTGTQLTLAIGSIKVKIEKPNQPVEWFTLEQPAVIRDDRTFIPLRAVAELFDIEILWDGMRQQITMLK